MFFTQEEKIRALTLYRQLYHELDGVLKDADVRRVKDILSKAVAEGNIQRNAFGLNPILMSLETAWLAVSEIGVRRDAVIAIMLCSISKGNDIAPEELEENFGEPVARIMRGLENIQQLYRKNTVVETENFRNLLFSLAEDVRVILIMIADRLNLMRQIRDAEQDELRRKVSEESMFLYAPLAHKLGLYRLKSELEDLSLKYTEHDAYYHIKDKLNETKASRDAYIERFIGPISERLQEAGLKFHIKGRTKSIHSIWQKMRKQRCPFEGVYDLFAIRIILDSPLEKEKMQCWQAFAMVTSMYQPNPKRLRDWVSVPKTNGYESLHITVVGPEQKWVEVQIRTERMDEVAERGVAAHWRYKGIKSDSGLDQWLSNIRTMLEASEGTESIDQFKMELYEDEVFVFTPKGDIYKFPRGATVLDFAYRIHSKIGNTCTGARINGRAVPLRHQLKSGDQVEILTASKQQPKQAWLNIVKTSHARGKIRQALNEARSQERILGREMLERKLKNHKMELDENILHPLIRKLGIKEAGDFYIQIARGELDSTHVIDLYADLLQKSTESPAAPTESASNFILDTASLSNENIKDDVLIIDRKLTGVDYHLSRCCNPIYGDPVFGFVSVSGGIKIHRIDCPNAPELQSRYPYRIVKAKWSGKGGSTYAVTLRLVGNDDIGIISNVTSIIHKEDKLTLRAINISSSDNIFCGNVTILVDDTAQLEDLIKKLQGVKGIKQVTRQ